MLLVLVSELLKHSFVGEVHDRNNNTMLDISQLHHYNDPPPPRSPLNNGHTHTPAALPSAIHE